jgi:hypothetical protein
MNIYMAAIHSNGYAGNGGSVHAKLSEREQQAIDSLKCDLESYHYVQSPRIVRHLRTTGIKVFLDSGAFSAHTLGVKLSVDAYCRYIHENADIIRVEDGIRLVSVLDGIGNEQLTYENQMRMERLGVSPLPCFHAPPDINTLSYDEIRKDERYLEEYVAKYDYITLGGMVGARVEQLQIWLDRMWGNYLTDGAGYPRVRVHGFGITSLDLMNRYPWASCDSSSWIQSASFGVIITSHGAVQISTKSPFRHVRGQHYINFTEIEQEVLTREIEQRGYDVNRLAERYEARAAFNVESFDQLAPTIKTKTFKIELPELIR